MFRKFVIAELGVLTTDPAINSAIAEWPFPSLAKSKGTRLGTLDMTHFYPAPMRMDETCHVHTGFPENLQRPMENIVDAFLYLGPGDSMVTEQMQSVAPPRAGPLSSTTARAGRICFLPFDCLRSGRTEKWSSRELARSR